MGLSTFRGNVNFSGLISAFFDGYHMNSRQYEMLPLILKTCQYNQTLINPIFMQKMLSAICRKKDKE
jgi:hypothetical protein